MIKSTIGDLLTNQLSQAPGHFLYVVKDGETVFYVGQSVNPVDRLQSHLGYGLHANLSRLGRLIKANLPEARAWTIELWSLEDCRPYLNGSPLDVTLCEQALIDRLAPCLNSAGTQRASELPARYQQRLTDAMPPLPKLPWEA